MEPAAIVTILAVAVAVVAVAVALITVAVLLAQISRRLQVVIRAVEEIPQGRTGRAHVLNRINTDLGQAQGTLEGLLAKSRLRARQSSEPRTSPVAPFATAFDHAVAEGSPQHGVLDQGARPLDRRSGIESCSIFPMRNSA